jgi:hypothetical protein
MTVQKSAAVRGWRCVFLLLVSSGCSVRRVCYNGRMFCSLLKETLQLS